MTYSIFMYGSNLSSEQLESRINNWNGNYEIAELPDHKLVFNKRKKDGTAAANIIKSPDSSSVWGIIIELDQIDLKQMDRYEGHPVHYQRQTYYVNGSDGEKNVQIYVAQPNFINPNLSISYDYFNKIIRGGICKGLPHDYIISTFAENLIQVEC